ncbi:hypothetical protein C8R46DRAFT_1040939 [Mycena filopes]|nr:hypothetical protein C8R46DRAFT_1040939 [Mycena filopes]
MSSRTQGRAIPKKRWDLLEQEALPRPMLFEVRFKSNSTAGPLNHYPDRRAEASRKRSSKARCSSGNGVGFEAPKLRRDEWAEPLGAVEIQPEKHSYVPSSGQRQATAKCIGGVSGRCKQSSDVSRPQGLGETSLDLIPIFNHGGISSPCPSAEEERVMPAHGGPILLERCGLRKAPETSAHRFGRREAHAIDSNNILARGQRDTQEYLVYLYGVFE